MNLLKLRGRDWLGLPSARRERIVDTCFAYWRTRGFPHYRLSDAAVAREYQQIADCDVSQIFDDDELRGSPLGLRLANSFHPRMWRVPMPGVRSPFERFQDDEMLRLMIRKALRVFPERFAVNASNLRRILQTYSRTARVSNFRPTAAKALYARYSGAGDRILDFSSGYGGRLLGCLTLPREYVGIDPCTAQIAGLHRMVTRLHRLVSPPGGAQVHQACAEDFLPQLPAQSCALVFSSPPYFDNERYSQEPTQSYRKFPRYDCWLEGFLRPVIEQAHRILEPQGFFVVNVVNLNGYPLADDTFRLAAKLFSPVTTHRLRLSQRPYLRGGFGTHRSEPIFVFRKARWRRTKTPAGRVALAQG